MEIIKANTVLEFEMIEQLARKIFPEHYGTYLQIKHVNYFIEEFQTAKAIEEQIQNGFEYYLLNESGESVAYLGIQKENNILILSKLYILNEQRGKGIGAKLLEFTEQRAIELNVSAIELIVNRLNDNAVEFYKRKGFEITEHITHEYESGYSMLEYKMKKILK